jgi:NAD(P)H dehydrogenase (quinone)
MQLAMFSHISSTLLHYSLKHQTERIAAMKYFFVYAHPEPMSLNGLLKDEATQALTAAGHQVEISDLYAMKWKAVADGEDFPERDPVTPLHYVSESGKAFRNGTQSVDVAEEQRKLLWSDVVVFQFPLWWYGMPAILKGWVDRVYALGFAYGVGEHGGARWGDRFGEGVLKGRKAMVAVTVGGRMAHYGPRGVNGAVDDILWPVQHGILFYPGMTVLPPTVLYEVERSSEESVKAMVRIYVDRLFEAQTTEPIAFRSQNGGDYNDVQVLKPEISPNVCGLAAHQREPAFVSNTSLGTSGMYTPQHFAPTSRE